MFLYFFRKHVKIYIFYVILILTSETIFRNDYLNIYANIKYKIKKFYF